MKLGIEVRTRNIRRKSFYRQDFASQRVRAG